MYRCLYKDIFSVKSLEENRVSIHKEMIAQNSGGSHNGVSLNNWAQWVHNMSMSREVHDVWLSRATSMKCLQYNSILYIKRKRSTVKKRVLCLHEMWKAMYHLLIDWLIEGMKEEILFTFSLCRFRVFHLFLRSKKLI